VHSLKKLFQRLPDLPGISNKLSALLKGPRWIPSHPRLGYMDCVPEVHNDIIHCAIKEEGGGDWGFEESCEDICCLFLSFIFLCPIRLMIYCGFVLDVVTSLSFNLRKFKYISFRHIKIASQSVISVNCWCKIICFSHLFIYIDFIYCFCIAK